MFYRVTTDNGVYFIEAQDNCELIKKLNQLRNPNDLCKLEGNITKISDNPDKLYAVIEINPDYQNGSDCDEVMERFIFANNLTEVMSTIINPVISISVEEYGINVM